MPEDSVMWMLSGEPGDSYVKVQRPELKPRAWLEKALLLAWRARRKDSKSLGRLRSEERLKMLRVSRREGREISKAGDATLSLSPF